MTTRWIRKPLLAGLGLATTFLLAVAGCGGKGMDSGDAVIVTAPGENVATEAAPTTAPSGAPAGKAASTSSAAPSTPAPAENVKAEGWGTLKGQITFDSNPPTPKDLVEKGKAPKDPEVCAKDNPIKSERMVVDAATKGVKNVLVYIPKPTAVNPEAKDAASKAEIVFDQEKCVFVPHVLAVMTGATITLKNSDPVNHNIDSKLKNNATNPNIPPNGTQPFVTQAAERTPGEVICDIHNWMKSYWMVTDSPYFAVTDAKGNFEIKNVPAGTQKVVVWQESVKGGFVTPSSGQPVNIPASGEAKLDLKIDAGKVLAE